jgi:hypothetical protein
MLSGPWFGPFALARSQVAIEPRPKKPARDVARPSLRVDSDLVLVPVTVVDQRNHPVTGLEKENFRVFDEGVERTITAFAMEDQPVALGLIFDHSGSVTGIRRTEAETTRMFLKDFQPRGRVLSGCLRQPARLGRPPDERARRGSIPHPDNQMGWVHGPL